MYVNFRFLKLHFCFEKLYVVVVQRKIKKCIKKVRCTCRIVAR